MDTTINGRVGQLVEALGKTNNSFAKSIGVSSSTINYIVNGKTKPGYELLDAILTTYPQVSSDWLMKSEGDIFRSDPPANKPADGGAFGEEILGKVSEGFSDMRRLFEDELRAKNQQIAFLQRMLEGALPGKLDDVTSDRSVLRTHPATERLTLVLVEQA